MDRNTNGVLLPGERDELETLVELSETLALVRAKALDLLGRRPDSECCSHQPLKNQPGSLGDIRLS